MSDRTKTLEDLMRNADDRESEKNGDFLVSAAIAAATDSAVLGTILGGDIAGAILGDAVDGELFD